jgi:hypothetical protein
MFEHQIPSGRSRQCQRWARGALPVRAVARRHESLDCLLAARAPGLAGHDQADDGREYQRQTLRNANASSAYPGDLSTRGNAAGGRTIPGAPHERGGALAHGQVLV